MGPKAKTDFLIPSPSLLSGVGRLFDWCGQYDQYNSSRTEDEADAKALFADWAAVGDDLVEAMSEFEVSQRA